MEDINKLLEENNQKTSQKEQDQVNDSHDLSNNKTKKVSFFTEKPNFVE